jgi:hypothetical protein
MEKSLKTIYKASQVYSRNVRLDLLHMVLTKHSQKLIKDSKTNILNYSAHTPQLT